MIAILVFAAVLSAVAGYGYYQASLHSFKDNKGDEIVTALRLVDAFVSNYSNLRTDLGADRAPVPATFRAHSIELFNQSRDAENVLRLRWIGRAGRAITTAPHDQAMAEAIESFVGQPSPKPRSEFLPVAGQKVFRTVYPSVAREQSCVDCHNKLQPEQHWQLNDIMGAFSIDVPAEAFLRNLLLASSGVAVALFLVIGGVGLWISLVHYRRIVDREAGQARLEISEKRFRDFAESSSDWFWEQDENLRTSFVSENAVSKRLLATLANEVGKTRREIVKLGVSEDQWSIHEAELAARRPFQKFRFQRIDTIGELRHIELSGKPIFDGDENFAGYRGTAKDITVEIANEIELTRRVEERTAELRRVQDELLRNERLSTLGQFTATIAHELRNPLSAIRNTAFTVAEATAARGFRLDRPINRLERSIARCDRLITDLLEYTKIRELKLLPLPLETWLSDVLDEQALPAGMTLKRDFAASNVFAHFDPDSLRRVVVNLVDNAAQALSEVSGDATERVLSVRTRATIGEATIEVEDNGPGIAPDLISKVFDPLFSTKSFGTGLGLPTVKQIVEQHGGTIEIASEFGRGTHVLVTLPLAPVVEELAA